MTSNVGKMIPLGQLLFDIGHHEPDHLMTGRDWVLVIKHQRINQRHQVRILIGLSAYHDAINMG